MEDATQPALRPALSDYLAAERTLLAWIRTGLALMGFGFVVARFALFLQEMQFIQHARAVQSYGLSLWFGTALIAAGVAVNLFSGWRHIQLIQRMNSGEGAPYHPARLAIATAFFLALVGVGMAIYLISVRDSAHPTSDTSKEESMAPNQADGVVSKQSNHSVGETLEKLKNVLQAKGVNIFAIVDHSGEAEKVGLKMPPTKLVIFGSPKAGTPLMLAAPSIAIDLPLKILIAQDSEGKVWVSYNSPAYLRERHGFPQDLLQNIAVVDVLVSNITQ